MDDLALEITSILEAFRLNFKKMSVVKDASIQFIVEQFGLIVCGLNRADYLMVSKAIEKQFGSGWRVVYVADGDSLLKKKEEILWDLMRSGYMRHIRYSYPRQFRELITMQNFDKKIIAQRLEVWNGQAKFKFLIEENQAALREASTYILSVDPGFYDHMP